MNKTPFLQAIKSLVPAQLNGYLLSQGWFEDGVLGEIATIWHRKEKEYHEFEIVQPLTINLKDYEKRVYDLVNVLSEFENRAFFDIADDLNNYHADIVKIRVVHDDVEGGSIPLNDGVLLFEKAKELMVSVVKSTFDKRKYFVGGKITEEVAEYINNIRLGQTEHGSYIVNVVAPIERYEEVQQDHARISVMRAVSDTLAMSLTAINEAIQEFKGTQRNDSFDDAVQKGVSANLCDALIGLSGEAKNRDVKITISMSKAEPILENAHFEHSFYSSNVPYLQKASDYYKEKYVLLDQKVSGLVIKLSHEEDEDYGVVTIEALVGDIEKNVSIQLPTIEYWEAHSAHKKLQLIECIGDLHVTPRSARLINIRGFRVFGVDDMFDED